MNSDHQLRLSLFHITHHIYNIQFVRLHQKAKSAKLGYWLSEDMQLLVIKINWETIFLLQEQESKAFDKKKFF